MGLFGDFSGSDVGQNLLGVSPQQQQNTLLNISKAFAAPKNRGETTFGNVLGAVTDSSATRQVDSDKRMSQVLSAMPKGVNFKNISPESKAMIKDYLRTGDQTLLMNIDFGASQANKGKVLPAMLGKYSTESLDTFAASGNFRDLSAITDSDTPSIESRYEGTTASGRSIRVGEDDAGRQYELTPSGAIPLTENVSKVVGVQKTQVVKGPKEIAAGARSGILKDPQWKMAEGTLTKVGRAKGLITQVQGGNSKSIPLLVRTVSEMYNADSRAQSEIDKLEQSGTIDQRIFDSIKSGTVGSLTEETMTDLLAVISAAENTAVSRMGEITSREYRGAIPQFTDPSVLGTSLISLVPPERVVGPVTDSAHREGMVFDDPETGAVYQVSSGHYIRIN